jgi:hypothetical protein
MSAEISPLLQQITGILPRKINTQRASEEYQGYLLAKHQTQLGSSLVKGNTIDTNKSSGK